MKQSLLSCMAIAVASLSAAAAGTTDDFNSWYDADTYLGYNTIQGVYNTELPNGWTALYTNKMSATQLYYGTAIGTDGSGALKHNATAAVTLVTPADGGAGSTVSLDVMRVNDTNPNQYVEIWRMDQAADGSFTEGEKLATFNASTDANASTFTAMTVPGLAEDGYLGIKFFGVVIDNYANTLPQAAVAFDGDDFETWADGYTGYGISSFQGIDTGTDLPNGWHGIFENTMSAQQLVYDKTIGTDGTAGLKNNSSKAITLVHELKGSDSPVTIKWDVKKNFDTASNQYLEIYTVNYADGTYTLGEKVGEYDVVGLCNASAFTTLSWEGNIADGLYGFRTYAISLDNFSVTREEEPLATYNLSCWLNGAMVHSVDLPEGAAIELPTFAEIVGRPFTEWKEEVPETMPAHDVALHGSYVVTPTGVSEIGAESTVEAVYTLQGVRVNSAPAAGLYIVRQSDGTVRKVMVR